MWPKGGVPAARRDICVRWQLPTSIAASAPATTTQMQIYCYSIIQFVAAYFARTLIPYNTAAVSITALLPETLKWYPNSGLKSRAIARLRENNLLHRNIYTLIRVQWMRASVYVTKLIALHKIHSISITLLSYLSPHRARWSKLVVINYRNDIVGKRRERARTRCLGSIAYTAGDSKKIVVHGRSRRAIPLHAPPNISSLRNLHS